MAYRKHIVNEGVISSPDSLYEHCNIIEETPEFDGNGIPQARDIFLPGPPITFRNCNLINVTPPAGSVIDHCSVMVVDFNAIIDQYEIVIDGVTIRCDIRDRAVYASWDAVNGSWSYYQAPAIGEVSA
jgi:hypothetical protein